MNQSITHFRNHEMCRERSPCYLLMPPPRPPIFPKFVHTNATNLHQRAQLLLIIFGLFLTLVSSCLLLSFVSMKFQFYHKLRQRYRRTKDANTIDPPSSIIPTTYSSLTPSTILTNQSSSLTKSHRSFRQSLNTDHRSFYSHHSLHIYEESDPYYSSHTQIYYPQRHQMTPYYYTCELSPSQIVCQDCLFETLHRKHQCLCHHFFVPIK